MKNGANRSYFGAAKCFFFCNNIVYKHCLKICKGHNTILGRVVLSLSEKSKTLVCLHGKVFGTTHFVAVPDSTSVCF